ncbi:MAG: type II toxin-antitoxin system MqsA family antitoxin, partial [Patescibacteria group bacterium]|nr:type II toxin-antitoxin system MqsA family antitoxin [Patescibacteria group bacterium]
FTLVNPIDSILIYIMDKCNFCGGELRTTTLQHFDYLWQNKTFRFENVPAHVCDACGEKYFDANISQAMNKAVINKEDPKRFDKIPVLDLQTSVPA